MLQVEHAGERARLGRERPADVLLTGARNVRTGAAGVVSGKIALDVGIVCPQAQSHLSDAAGERLGAAEAYVKHKCGHHSVERRCRERGVVFQPMIFESTGGVSVEAEGVIKCLSKAVADNQDSPEGEVATLFWHRLAIDLQRAGHRALARRLRQRGVDGGVLGGGSLMAPHTLEMPEGI